MTQAIFRSFRCHLNQQKFMTKNISHPFQPHLVCGLNMELNVTSDLDLFISTSQLELLNCLGIQLAERLKPPHQQQHHHQLTVGGMTTNTYVPSQNSNSAQVTNTPTTDASANSTSTSTTRGHHHLSTKDKGASGLNLPNNRGGGDSGVESDMSTLATVADNSNAQFTTHSTGNINNVNNNAKRPRAHFNNVDNKNSAPNGSGTTGNVSSFPSQSFESKLEPRPATHVHNRAPLGGGMGSRAAAEGGTSGRVREGGVYDGESNDSSNGGMSLLWSKIFMDLLVTAGKVSCTVYMHKVSY